MRNDWILKSEFVCLIDYIIPNDKFNPPQRFLKYENDRCTKKLTKNDYVVTEFV